MGMLFQNGALLTDLDVFENVAFPLREHTRLPERLIRTHRADQAARGRACAAPRACMPQQLSGGMARRVALARAIVMDPDILIYDEPFAGLDPISMGVVMRLIRSLNDALGITSIVVTHDVREISQIADLSYILSEGRSWRAARRASCATIRRRSCTSSWTASPTGPVPFHYPAPDYYEQLLDAPEARDEHAVASMLASFAGVPRARRRAGAFLRLRLLWLTPPALLRPRLIIEQVYNAGALSLVIIMTCGLFVGMVHGPAGLRPAAALRLGGLARHRRGAHAAEGTRARWSRRCCSPGAPARRSPRRLGLMRATDQLSAMEIMAVDPMRRVVLPRFLGGVIAMPLLTAIFIAVGLFGVQLVGVQFFGVDQGQFWSQMRGAVELDDVREGLIKGLVFGVACSLIAVFEGYNAEPTAEGVGRATTRTVVISAVVTLVLDYILTAIML